MREAIPPPDTHPLRTLGDEKVRQRALVRGSKPRSGITYGVHDCACCAFTGLLLISETRSSIAVEGISECYSYDRGLSSVFKLQFVQ